MHFYFFSLLVRSPTSVPDQTASRKKLSESKTPFIPDAFIQSVIAGDTLKVVWFLRAGMNPDVSYEGEKYFQVGNKVISGGDPALIIAIIPGHGEIVSLLLSHGAGGLSKGADGKIYFSGSNKFDDIFAPLGRADFDRALQLAKTLKSKEAALLAQFAICKGVLRKAGRAASTKGG